MDQTIQICFETPPTMSTRFAWNKAGRYTDPAADQIRAGHQPDDSQGARPCDPGGVSTARRRGDRIKMLFAAVRECICCWHEADLPKRPLCGCCRGESGPRAHHARTRRPGRALPHPTPGGRLPRARIFRGRRASPQISGRGLSRTYLLPPNTATLALVSARRQ